MQTPAIVVWHDTPDIVVQPLRRRYGTDYAVRAVTRADALLATVEDEPDGVAVVIAAATVGGRPTLPVLAGVSRVVPRALRCVLSPTGDRVAAQQLYAAVDAGQVDRCLPTPWGHPDVGLHPRVAEMLAEWWRRREPEAVGAYQLTVVAAADAPRLAEMRDLADRNNVPTRFLTPDSTDGEALWRRAGAATGSVVVAAAGRAPLVDPTVTDIGGLVGARLRPSVDECDVVIVGAGPAGLAAAVHAASEGLSTVVLEPHALGGQAGTSSAIRNYPGFPYGISGRDLATLLSEQAWLLGAQTVYRAAESLTAGGETHALVLAGGSELRARAVILATGVRYRRLAAPGVDRLQGTGVFYGAARAQARHCAGQPVYVVGAGNSAGQAAVHLAEHAATVTILIRGDGLAATMSDYLVRQIARTPNITLRTHSEISEAHGDGHLEALTIAAGDRRTTEPAAALFVMIGAEPDTGWLPAQIVRDPHGFVVTGTDLGATEERLTYETSTQGVFAIGDVRHGSVKRVATAVGEGAVSVAAVHTHLARRRSRVPAAAGTGRADARA